MENFISCAVHLIIAFRLKCFPNIPLNSKSCTSIWKLFYTNEQEKYRENDQLKTFTERQKF